MTSPTPQIIAGRYEVLDELGHGSQGTTYKVRDRHQGELVALKLLRGLNPFGPWHEAVVLTQLRDEHILPIRNADFFSGVPGIVTELAQHGTVQDKIKAAGAAGIDPRVAVRWVRQACLAAARTHDADLIHTDIKPENLFLNEHEDVRLGDYGLASLVDASGKGICSGTAETLAPEIAQLGLQGQIRGTTARSDVYSLGATLYWMLTSQPAFHAQPGPMDLPAILSNKRQKLRDLAPHVSQALSLRVERAMESDPGQRYATPGDFAAALGRLPAPRRDWYRTDEDTGHLGCWRGDHGKRSTVLVCAVTLGRKAEITAAKLPHRYRIRDASGIVVAMTKLPAALREIFNSDV